MKALEILRNRKGVRRFYHHQQWEGFLNDLLNGSDNRIPPQNEDSTIPQVDTAIQRVKTRLKF